MAFYPLSVLATNRILDTVISRKKSCRLARDLIDTWKIGGLRALYAAFLPYFLINLFLNYSFTTHWEEITIGNDPKSEMGPFLKQLYSKFGILGREQKMEFNLPFELNIYNTITLSVE
jgi:hypothetical protein